MQTAGAGYGKWGVVWRALRKALLEWPCGKQLFVVNWSRGKGVGVVRRNREMVNEGVTVANCRTNDDGRKSKLILGVFDDC